MRVAFCFGLLLLGCAAQAVGPAGPVSSRAGRTAEVGAEAVAEADPDPVQRVEAALTAVEMDGVRTSRLPAQLEKAAVDEPLVVAAAEQLVDEGQDSKLLAALVGWLGDHGTEASLPILYRIGEGGNIHARIELENVLARVMEGELGACEPPSPEEVAAAGAGLVDFAVIERGGARAATAAERGDLAYFLAAVSENEDAVASDPNTHRSATPPSKDEVEQRVSWLKEIDAAQHAGAVDDVQTIGAAYLKSLGFPGAIDLGQEAHMTWGGPQVWNVMRDVALASEVVGELEIAGALYHRANPGGGACGTSVGYRWEKQVKGYIRAVERTQGCRPVVVERLLDVGGSRWRASAYGPQRLRDAGFDIGRLYRGALLTRNRATEAEDAWEYRVRAAEGLAAELDREGVEALFAVLPVADDALRVRTLSAIGRAMKRWHVGPCPTDTIHLSSIGFGGGWEREVPPISTSCDNALTDDEALAMAKRIAPYLGGHDEVHAAALEAIGQLAAPGFERRLKKERARAREALARCKKKDPDECWDQSHLVDTADEALAYLDELRTG